MNQLVCYCFGYTEEDIIADFFKGNGTSSILKRITAAKKNNNCQSDDKHPEKR